MLKISLLNSITAVGMQQLTTQLIYAAGSSVLMLALSVFK
jgi:hypothetical protein